jgi:general secretion pathway protein B
MSLILDALKRAERERRGDAGPALRDMPPPVIAGMALPPRARRAVPFAVIAAAALALCAFLLWDAFRPAPPPAPAAEAPFAPKPVEPQAAIQARPAPPETAVVPGTEDVASLDDLTDESALDDPAVPEPPKPVPAKPAQKSATIRTTPAPPPLAAEVQSAPSRPAPQAQAPAVEARPAPAQPTPTPAPPPQAAPAPPPPETAPVETPPAEVPPALTQPAPLRKFREMPPDYRKDFPTLRVEIHVYEKDPKRRFVMIHGRRYREGERLAEGPALVEVVPEGMVLEYRGEKVLYTLGR